MLVEFVKHVQPGRRGNPLFKQLPYPSLGLLVGNSTLQAIRLRGDGTDDRALEAWGRQRRERRDVGRGRHRGAGAGMGVYSNWLQRARGGA